VILKNMWQHSLQRNLVTRGMPSTTTCLHDLFHALVGPSRLVVRVDVFICGHTVYPDMPFGHDMTEISHHCLAFQG